MVIRPTSDEDVAALHALVTAVSRERAYLGSTEGFTLEQTGAYLAHLRQSGGVALVATVQDRLVGWIDVSRGPFEGLTHYGRLGMGLAVDVRGKGLGRLLLERALAAAFESGLERVELEVFASNTRAVALYRRTGFVEEGCRRRARKLDGTYDDILLFGLLRDEWRGDSIDP
jgi:RimJ/RimL family protein N-acetyltransferase